MSLVHLERIHLRLSTNATLVALNHNLSILCYTYYSTTRKVYYVVIESLTPIRLCFRKKVTSLNWIFIDNRDILITSFESGYIGCFDINGRLLFKQQIDSKPISNIFIASAHRDREREDLYQENIDVLNENIPNLFCLMQSADVILITSYDLYSTLKYSNFDISQLCVQEKKEYFQQIERDKKRQENKLKQHKYPKYTRLQTINNEKYTRSISLRNKNRKLHKNNDMLPSSYKQYKEEQKQEQEDMMPLTFAVYDDIKDSEQQIQNGCTANENNNNNNNNSLNQIPITTILPLRPICNQVLFWNAKKITIGNNQNIKCFAAYFFPKSNMKKTAELLQNGHNRSSSMKYNHSAHQMQSLNIKYNKYNDHRLSRSQSMYELQDNEHNAVNIAIAAEESKEKEKNDLSDLLDPKIAFKQDENDENDEWLLLFCGSDPILSTAHIQIKRGIKKVRNNKNSKLDKKRSKNWLSAAKSLFISQNQKKSMSSSSLLNNNNTEKGEKSPSKSQRMNINPNKNKKKNKKKKSREEIALHQKQFQHKVRNMKYSKYGIKCELKMQHVTITDIIVSPCSKYGAFTDCFGRIWIWKCKQCKFVRVFKGYRHAQIGWFYCNDDIDKLSRNNKYTSIPRYIYRRSTLLLILYISSRGLLEFHVIECKKRLYAVNIFKNAQMIYHLNYSVSPAWSNILFVHENNENNENEKKKIYKLCVNPMIIHSKLNRRMNECWNRNNIEIENNAVRLLSDVEFVANIKNGVINIFGTQCISLYDANIDIIQWFLLIEKCEGDICCGLQCINKEKIHKKKELCFAQYTNGWGFHRDGFLKHNASYTGFGWKYGKYDTIGIILNVAHKDVPVLQFTLNGKLCKQINNKKTKITLPINNNNYHYIYRLAVSVSINSHAQIAIIAHSK